MSSDSCIVLHPCTSDSGRPMKIMNSHDASSDEVDKLDQKEQNQQTEDVPASLDTVSSNANKPIENTTLIEVSDGQVIRSSSTTLLSRPSNKFGKVVSVGSSPTHFSRQNSEDNLGSEARRHKGTKRPSTQTGRKGNGIETPSNIDLDDTTTNATSTDGELKRTGPQHETETLVNQEKSSDQSSMPIRDVDFEVTLLSQRNKRVLLSRLLEVAPRGKLSMINLCRRGIGVEEARLLKQAIIRNPQLCVLKLSYNNLGDEGAAIVASSLTDGSQHHQLSVLDLGFNSIGDVGCGYLAVHCLAGNDNLQTLYLSGNQIREKGALSIAGAILHGSSLQSLYLSANEIGPMGMKTIAGAIAKNEARLLAMRGDLNRRQNRSMEVLHLSGTCMESSGFMAIPGMLLTNSSLRQLCVSDNNLDDQDILLLSQALTQNKLVPLESLQLSFNEVTCTGVECLMNSVWGSKTLRELKLDNNKIQDRGAQLCAVVLTSIPLQSLDLSFNRITTTGIKALMKNLSENNSLQSLGLSGIPIDQNASKAVSYALAYNTSLRALHVDNCSTGYASQRHIVAGAVSNQRSTLRVLTGFLLSPIAMTLGMPRLPEEWSNDQVLGFFRLMWSQWLLKSRQGNNSQGDDDTGRGPAPPAAVAAAAKIAFASLGTRPPNKLFQTEQHEKPVSERAPVEPAGSALLERSDSGTMRVPLFTVSSEVGLSDFVDGESKAAVLANNAPSPQLATVRSPLDNPERRNRNLQWLRLHFRALSEVGRLPFNNADLWQLHQYYFSPPLCQTEEDEAASTETPATHDGQNRARSAVSNHSASLTRAAASNVASIERSVSFQTLGDAIALLGEGTTANSHKRRPNGAPEEAAGRHVSKRAKNLKTRIAYYPRIMAKIQSLGTRPTSDTLSLLRQLKYAESVMFANRNPYADTKDASSDEPCHSDIDMILLDLL